MIIVPLLGKDLEMSFVEQQLPTKEEEALLKNFWSKKERQGFFNGELLSVERSHCSDYRIALELSLSNYKNYLASRSGILKKPILSLSVSSIIAKTDGEERFLVGRRGSRLANCPDYLEFVGSGSVEPIRHGQTYSVDPGVSILEELKEEAGIACSEVIGMTAFVLIVDFHNRCVDICYKLILSSRGLKSISNSKEYPQIFWMSKAAIAENIGDRKFVPTSAELFRCYQDFFCGV